MGAKQRRYILEWLKAHREAEPSVVEAALSEWPALIVPVAIIAAGFWLAIAEVELLIGYFLVGLGVGVLGTRLGLVAVRLRAFRVYRSVADWSKVEEELAK